MTSESFDMFAAQPPFLTRIAAIARRRTELDPAEILALLVTAISAEAVVIAQAILPEDVEEGEISASESLRAMSDALKFVVMNAEHFTEEEIEERVDAALDPMTDETRERLSSDPIGALREAFGPCEDPCEESSEEEEEVDSDYSEESDVSEEGSDDCMNEEELKEAIAEAAEAWDEWNPTDPLLESMKHGFANSFEEAIAEIEREEAEESAFV
jgi:polyhydroxyalkanoate synthesis regulator phasin